MKKFVILSLLFCWGWMALSAQWQPDVLGDGYEMRYVEQPDDYSGKVRCTIVRKLSKCGLKRAVLYVHGFNDYFFQSIFSRWTCANMDVPLLKARNCFRFVI